MTITEKILAAHCGRKEVSGGELINAKVDLILANDITAPISITEFSKIGPLRGPPLNRSIMPLVVSSKRYAQAQRHPNKVACGTKGANSYNHSV